MNRNTNTPNSDTSIINCTFFRKHLLEILVWRCNNNLQYSLWNLIYKISYYLICIQRLQFQLDPAYSSSTKPSRSSCSTLESMTSSSKSTGGTSSGYSSLLVDMLKYDLKQSGLNLRLFPGNLDPYRYYSQDQVRFSEGRSFQQRTLENMWVAVFVIVSYLQTNLSPSSSSCKLNTWGYLDRKT